MTASTRSMIMDALADVPIQSVADILATFEVERSDAFINETLDELIADGEIHLEVVAKELGPVGHVVHWLRAPAPPTIESLDEVWQEIPTVDNLVKTGIWTPEHGDYFGVFNKKSPLGGGPARLGYRCAWSCNYTGLGAPEILGPYLPDLPDEALLLEVMDYTGTRNVNATVMALGQFCLVNPLPWSKSVRGRVNEALLEIRTHIAPSYIPHWKLERFGDGWKLPMRIFGSPSTRRGWLPYSVSHSIISPKQQPRPVFA